MKIVGYALTDVGKERKENQDAYYLDDELGLWLVCDGMGGHAAGDVASQTTARTVARVVEHRKDLFADEWDEATDQFMSSVVQAGVQESCMHLQEQVKQSRVLAGMGTTLTLLLRVGQRMCMGHVGDSRLYLLRKGEIHLLSNDHTLVHELYRQGLIKESEMKTSPYAHVLSRSIGHQEAVMCDTLLFDFLPGDVFMICSDGVSNAFEAHEEMKQQFKTGDPSKLAEQLVRGAVERDGSDNATAVVVWVQDESASQRERERSAVVSLKIETLKQMYLFSDLSLQELLLLMENVSMRECSPKEMLIREGEVGQNLFIILSGKCAVSRGGKQVATLLAGSHFGEMSLLSQAPRSASVLALEETKLLQISREALLKFVRQESQSGVTLLWRLGNELASRLEKANLELYGKTI